MTTPWKFSFATECLRTAFDGGRLRCGELCVGGVELIQTSSPSLTSEIKPRCFCEPRGGGGGDSLTGLDARLACFVTRPIVSLSLENSAVTAFLEPCTFPSPRPCPFLGLTAAAFRFLGQSSSSCPSRRLAGTAAGDDGASSVTAEDDAAELTAELSDLRGTRFLCGEVEVAELRNEVGSNGAGAAAGLCAVGGAG